MAAAPGAPRWEFPRRTTLPAIGPQDGAATALQTLQPRRPRCLAGARGKRPALLLTLARNSQATHRCTQLPKRRRPPPWTMAWCASGERSAMWMWRHGRGRDVAEAWQRKANPQAHLNNRTSSVSGKWALSPATTTEIFLGSAMDAITQASVSTASRLCASTISTKLQASMADGGSNQQNRDELDGCGAHRDGTIKACTGTASSLHQRPCVSRARPVARGRLWVAVELVDWSLFSKINGVILHNHAYGDAGVRGRTYGCNNIGKHHTTTCELSRNRFPRPLGCQPKAAWLSTSHWQHSSTAVPATGRLAQPWLSLQPRLRGAQRGALPRALPHWQSVSPRRGPRAAQYQVSAGHGKRRCGRQAQRRAESTGHVGKRAGGVRHAAVGHASCSSSDTDRPSGSSAGWSGQLSYSHFRRCEWAPAPPTIRSVDTSPLARAPCRQQPRS